MTNDSYFQYHLDDLRGTEAQWVIPVIESLRNRLTVLEKENLGLKRELTALAIETERYRTEP